MYVYALIAGLVSGRIAVRHTKTSSNILKGRKCVDNIFGSLQINIVYIQSVARVTWHLML